VAVFIGLLKREADGACHVSFPDFPDCQTVGHTMEEASARAVDVLAAHVSLLQKKGEAVPQPSSMSKVMEDPQHHGMPIIRVAVPDEPGQRITNDAEIERLVRAFYMKVRADAMLGPIFNNAIGDEWEPHLHKMFDFWSSVMLTTGRYKGQPMRAHMRLKMVREEHFERWLMLFRETADEICTPEIADSFVEKAARIAESLQLGMFFRPALHDPEPTQGQRH